MTINFDKIKQFIIKNKIIVIAVLIVIIGLSVITAKTYSDIKKRAGNIAWQFDFSKLFLPKPKKSPEPTISSSPTVTNKNTSKLSSSSSQPESTASSGSANSGFASCGANNSFFTNSPLDQADFKGLVPLGNLNPSGHVFPTDHIYFYLSNVSSRYNLYAPGNVTIISISGSEHVSQGFTDYSFDFQPCQELRFQFGHVSSLSDKLNQALTAPYDTENTYSTGGQTYRMFSKNVSIAVSAGEQLGTVGGNSGQNALDMGAYDTRKTINFANSSRWSQRGDTTHTVCPIDYYSGDLKNTLMARFGDYDGDRKRTIEPICGTIEQDVNETSQGVWFISGTSNSWSGEDSHLALVHDNINPNTAVFSVGTSMSSSGLSSGTYQFSPQSSGQLNRDFDEVRSDNNIYCYEPSNISNEKIILLLTSNTNLKIEKQSGSCGFGPGSFTASASEFER